MSLRLAQAFRCFGSEVNCMNQRYWLWLAGGLVVIPAWAQSQLKSQGQTSVKFTASGPAGLSIEGTTSELMLSEADGQVRVTVPLGKLTTGISLRDKHMREKYLETPKYPTAELTTPSSAIKRPATGGQSQASGQMTIHGVTKPVTIKYTARPEGKAYVVDGTTHVRLGDFGITVPSYLGVTVKPDIDIQVHFSAIEL
jgi:polyisoprenoid-binding protein YceI